MQIWMPPRLPEPTAFLLQETSLRPESFQPKSKMMMIIAPISHFKCENTARSERRKKKQPIGVFVGSFLPSVIIESSGGWISIDFINSTARRLNYHDSPNRVSSFTQASPNNYAEKWTNSQVFSKLPKKTQDQNNFKANHIGDASLLVPSCKFCVVDHRTHIRNRLVITYRSNREHILTYQSTT